MAIRTTMEHGKASRPSSGGRVPRSAPGAHDPAYLDSPRVFQQRTAREQSVGHRSRVEVP